MHSILVRRLLLFGREKKLTEEAKKSSPAAYSYLSATALDDLQHDYSAILNEVLSHASLRPPNLGIIPGRKAWLLTLDLMVLSDAGNIYDALFMAARAALWDTRVPRTRAVEYRPDKKGGGDGMDVDSEPQSALDTRGAKAPAADFELEDSWDDGVVLGGRDAWPLSVTLNLVRTFFPSCSPFRCLSYRRDTNTVSGCALSGRHNAGGGGHTSASDPDILLPHGITSGSSRDAPTRYRRHRSRSDRVISEGEPLQCPSTKKAQPNLRAYSKGWGKVCAADVQFVKRKLEGRGTTPDREGSAEVLRCTMRRLRLQKK